MPNVRHETDLRGLLVFALDHLVADGMTKEAANVQALLDAPGPIYASQASNAVGLNYLGRLETRYIAPLKATHVPGEPRFTRAALDKKTLGID